MRVSVSPTHSHSQWNGVGHFGLLAGRQLHCPAPPAPLANDDLNFELINFLQHSVACCLLLQLFLSFLWSCCPHCKMAMSADERERMKERGDCFWWPFRSIAAASAAASRLCFLFLFFLLTVCVPQLSLICCCCCCRRFHCPTKRTELPPLN